MFLQSSSSTSVSTSVSIFIRIGIFSERFALHVSVQFPRHKRTCRPLVSLIESLRTEVEMFPAAKDILGDGVEVVTPMLVTIIVVVTAGEAVHRVTSFRISHSSSLADVGLGRVLPA